MMRSIVSTLLFASLLASSTLMNSSTVLAQFEDDVEKKEEAGGSRIDQARTIRFQVGVIIKSTGSALKAVEGTTPIPLDWPEQSVRIVDTDMTRHVKSITYRNVGKTVKQMVVKIPRLESGGTAKALVTFQVTRHSMLAPEKTDEYRIPKKIDSLVRPFLAPSPYIEMRNAKIRKLADKLFDESEELTDWQRVEKMYDWVRDNIEYKKGDLKGALAALNDGYGDCEEMSSLFIALCRLNKIPARTVWIPGHCYPEFYLVDAEDKGHWFPCQAAGSRDFGSMPEFRVILQKGDNFKVKGERKRQRYVSEKLRADALGDQKPNVKFVREVLPNTP